MRKPLHLNLSFGSSSWIGYRKRLAIDSFKDFEKKVHERDNHTCGYCGFTAQKHMSVVNIDQNYANNTMGNMTTACPFCKQCLFLETVGSGEDNGGVLIYMPEISQADLNGISHALFCAIANATVHEHSANNIYCALKLRSKPVESVYGEELSNPKLFGQMVLNTPGCEKSHQNKILEGLRLLPLINNFRGQIKDWSQNAASAMEKEVSLGGNISVNVNE